MTKKLYVFPDVGRTGLCNMLFPWARSVLFARNAQCEILAPRWTKLLRIGQWLRNERDKRYYTGQFTNAGYITGFRKFALLATLYGERVSELEVDLATQKSGMVVFRGLGKYFEDLLGETEFVKSQLLKIVNPDILNRLSQLPPRFIGVHVRCGDFATTGQSLPLEYYLRGIESARGRVGSDVPVLVFSDAKPSELELLKSENSYIMPPAPAIQDVLSLSQSVALVGTNHSSFSEWASFLGGMPSFWSAEGRSPSKGINAILV